MHKRKTAKTAKALCLLLTAALLTTGFIGLPKAQAQQLTQDQTAASEKIWQTDRCRITYRLTDRWTDGYTAAITLQNLTSTPIENWHVALSLPHEPTNLWNAQIIDRTRTEEDDGTKTPAETATGTIFKNLGWNQDIPAGASVTFGYTAAGSFDGFPEICELPVSQRTVPEDDYEITVTVPDDWSTGYSARLNITNRSDKPIEDWQLSFDLPCDITDLWNAQILSHEDDRYLIKNQDYNQNIAPGDTLQIGFVVNDGSAKQQPRDFLLQEYTLDTSDGTTSADPDDETDPGETDSSDGGTTPGDDIDPVEGDNPGDDTDPAQEHNPDKEIALTIDTDSFDENETWEMYLTDQYVTHLSGTLQGAQKVETLTYVITDLYENVIDSGEIDIQEAWQAEDIGLVLGMNFITVTAVCAQDGASDDILGERSVQVQISLMNFNKQNMETADVDLTDTDGDGLPNYFETVYGTDPLLADTDGDGLTDFAEITQTGTDPLKSDTDDNGVPDGQEDPDGDGLTNLEELTAGTGALYPDTDGDGLSDGEEIRQYHTDPLTADTDADGLTDGEDIRLGFDPLNPDTDRNGTLDGDEIIPQTYTKAIDPEKKPGITQISVSMDCAGALENHLLIQDVYGLDTRSTDVVGLIGVPVQIETEEAFDTATITFTYDETALGQTPEENLRIMWYDKENDRYHLLDDETVPDTEHNTLTCVTGHFSTWLVVDREVWWLALQTDLGYGDTQENTTGWLDASYYLTSAWILNCEDYTDQNTTTPAGKYLTVLQERMERWPTPEYSFGRGYIHSMGSYVNGTITDAIQLSLTRLNYSQPSQAEKQIYIFSITDIDYDEQLVEKTAAQGISIHCVTGVHCHNENMQKIASRTGGKYLTLTSWTEAEIIAYINKHTEQYLETRKDAAAPDSDGDGLPDTMEQNGIRLSNGVILYTDPYKYDTDGDGISDYDEVGGLPREETYTADGEAFTAMVARGGACNRLSEDFLYVDGRVNENGVVNSEKMGYVSYSDHFVWDKYEKTFKKQIFNVDWDITGAAGIHGVCAEKYENANAVEKAWYRYFYYQVNNMVYDTMLLSSYDPNLEICFYRYLQGQGGRYAGCVENGTREYLLANYLFFNTFSLDDSIKGCFEENMQKAKAVAESVLNEYNTEIYISLSPKTTWSGCQYVDYTKNQWASSAVAIASNISAFGIFNSADASVTLHCTYNPDVQQYTMEFVYYIVDFYDYSAYGLLMEQDALGLARSYELFGYCPGTMVWKTGKKPIVLLEGYK